MNNANTKTWYAALVKPSWAPPSWLFGPVWTVLYVIIAASYGTVFYKAATLQIPALVALPFALNLVFNAAFTPIQLRLRSNALAAVDIVLVLVTLLWALFSIYATQLQQHISTGGSDLLWIALVNIPYLLWVMFATVLQLTITYLNK